MLVLNILWKLVVSLCGFMFMWLVSVFSDGGFCKVLISRLWVVWMCLIFE